jgi:hypothetical protein
VDNGKPPIKAEERIVVANPLPDLFSTRKRKSTR